MPRYKVTRTHRKMTQQRLNKIKQIAQQYPNSPRKRNLLLRAAGEPHTALYFAQKSNYNLAKYRVLRQIQRDNYAPAVSSTKAPKFSRKIVATRDYSTVSKRYIRQWSLLKIIRIKYFE